MDMNYDVRVILMHFATSKFNIETIECFVNRDRPTISNFWLI